MPILGGRQEYFADLPTDAPLDAGQRQAVRCFREALARSTPAYVRPELTSGALDDHYMLELLVRHDEHADVFVRLIYGDGYLSLTWPDGEAHDRYEWSRRLERTVDGLLSARNRQTFRQRLGRTYAVDTDILDSAGRRIERWRQWRRAALVAAVLVVPERTRDRTISFDSASGFAS